MNTSIQWLKNLTILSALLIASCTRISKEKPGTALFVFNDNLEARWSSPENRNGMKGEGGKENNTAKGHAFDSIAASESYSLLDIQAQGIINRIWITISDRSPEMLRSLKLEMFWDGENKPAVSVPIGDFFGVGLGRTTAFQNALFANAEGRSFNCFIPMPFKKGARITVTNESGRTLHHIFYDVDYSLLKNWDADYLYFHSFWHRDTATTPGTDFELLPELHGKGRFLGVNIGVNANPVYKKSWFGEGEVKMYLDGDKEYPSLNGTGTEDYIGTAWGQKKFINNYTGCTVSNDSLMQWAFYRYHIVDPVYFSTDCRVTIQQIGGNYTPEVAMLQKEGAPLIPISTDFTGRIQTYYSKGKVETLDPEKNSTGWTNFYRSDDVSSTAYFYLDTPSSELSPLQAVELRACKLKDK
jgi:hypothetical protein